MCPSSCQWPNVGGLTVHRCTVFGTGSDTKTVTKSSPPPGPAQQFLSYVLCQDALAVAKCTTASGIGSGCHWHMTPLHDIASQDQHFESCFVLPAFSSETRTRSESESCSCHDAISSLLQCQVATATVTVDSLSRDGEQSEFLAGNGGGYES